MAKDIDKLFREQLSRQSFEWNEAYWEAAEAAIEAAERKRRRRFLLFWWFGGTASLGLVLMIWLGSDKPEPVRKEQAQDVVEQPIARNLLKKGPPSKEIVREEEKCDDTPMVANVPGPKSVVHPVIKGGVPNETAFIPISDPVQTSSYISVMNKLPGIDYVIQRDVNPGLRADIPARVEPSIEPQNHPLVWRAGVGAGGGLQGLFTGAQPGVWTGGIFQGSLYEKWGWSAGLQYHIQHISDIELGSSEQSTFGFGENHTRYVSYIRSVHQLQIPAGILFRPAQKLQIEAGAILSYRLAVRGVIEERSYPKPWERTQSEQSEYEARLGSYFSGEIEEFPLLERSSVFAQGWLDAGKERAFQVQPFAGLQFDAGKRFTLSGRVAYRSGKPWPGGSDSLEIGPWSVSAGIFYWIR
ncbi:MAG: hypothetical protein IPH04_17515 [Saprospirales bacterium]|nr:hypothetical protein [Saprospirales bacterium]